MVVLTILTVSSVKRRGVELVRFTSNEIGNGNTSGNLSRNEVCGIYRQGFEQLERIETIEPGETTPS